jgi:hypothetical protein
VEYPKYLAHTSIFLQAHTAKIFGCVPEQGDKYFQSQEHLKQMIEKLDINELSQMVNTNFNKAKQMTWNVMAQKTIAAYSA